MKGDGEIEAAAAGDGAAKSLVGRVADSVEELADSRMADVDDLEARAANCLHLP